MRPSREGLGEWLSLPFFRDGHADAIEARLEAEAVAWLPAPDRVYAALRLTPPEAVRVVILGQDPYPTPGHANGLAFSVNPDVAPLPRSLANIFRELGEDIGAVPGTGDLSGWARQGVLLINTALTVPAGEAGGHARLGWARLVADVLGALDRAPRAFLLWGRQAQQVAAARLANPDHLRIETAHPSPLSARRGFFGSRPFSRVNDWLVSRGEAPINWAGG
ncbi:Uracil-DNA glycosylase [Meinhardsimonia xiamenensis]|jgi:uracil-DNA glycosylase|uniref:Uracil-DNA glycosylase n=1 Tax=Meinhardsimonia xiamenensis TaxID=990712 RepID=A0A1G9B2E3_9RHOB|nr:uracil-DNA glycosylase [Meinhardsimonia xiamenensis]PRX35151.1 uracil-DNA glycosylase [Meinhardsimonia xiamenensis]SDK33648.1 Uracil-DNA glycosylase [Meinhardsimonia xiamenensis]